MVKPKAKQNRKCDRHIFRAARASCMPVLVPRARRSLGTFQKPKSLFWAPPVYKDLSTRYDWPVKNATVDLSASQTESVRLKDRRQQRGNVHALFLLPCRLSVTPSSETQGQIVGTRESLNGRKNVARRKVKNGEKSPWGRCLTRLVPNGRPRSGF